MKDVGAKPVTLRIAKAQAVVRMPEAVLAMLKARTLEKGDALEIARAAGLLAAKRTADLLPLCHPMTIDRMDLRYEFSPAQVRVLVEVETQARTGVEMEALTGASLAALTLYDMLKPHAGTDLVISDVLLLSKTGGKSDFKRADPA